MIAMARKLADVTPETAMNVFWDLRFSNMTFEAIASTHGLTWQQVQWLARKAKIGRVQQGHRCSKCGRKIETHDCLACHLEARASVGNHT